MFAEYFFAVGTGLTVVVVGGLGTLAWKRRNKISAWLARLARWLTGRRRQKYVHNLPYLPLGNLLKGRDKALTGLAKALRSDPGSAVISQAKTIHGEGGVGKTRLAVEFAWSELNAARCKAAYFIRGDTPERLDAQIASLYPILYPGQATPQKQSDTIQAVIAALTARTDWLLIVDNVDQPDARAHLMSAYVPRLTSGRILITSRLSDWPQQLWAFALTALDEKSAVAYLLEKTQAKRARTSGDKTDARDLAKALDFLPIALEQAAAYITNTKIGIRDYLDKLAESPAALLDKRIEGTTDHPSSVLRVWETTEQKLTPGANAVLRLASFLAPEPIPRALFDQQPETITTAIELLTGEEADSGQDRPKPDELLGELARWSMIALADNTFTVHRLTQDTVRLRIEKQKLSAWTQSALALLIKHASADPPPDDVRSWPRWEAIEAHAQTVISRYANADDDPSAFTSLMNELGLYFKARARFAEAESLYRRALEIDEAAFGPDHPKVASDLNYLAQLLQATDRLDEAEPMIRCALKIDEATSGPNHPKVAIRLNNLAALLKTTNRLEEAEPMMRRALEIDEAEFGPEHQIVAIRLNNLAQLLKATNRLDEAESMMRRALGIDEVVFGPNHPRVASELNNLAQLLKDTNRLDEAEPMMRRALESDEAAFGPDHPNVAIRLNNLANLLQATDRLDEAEPLARRSLAIFRASLGEEHPNTKTALAILRAIEKALGKD